MIHTAIEVREEQMHKGEVRDDDYDMDQLGVSLFYCLSMFKMNWGSRIVQETLIKALAQIEEADYERERDAKLAALANQIIDAAYQYVRRRKDMRGEGGAR